MKALYEGKNHRVFILTFKEYLQTFFPDWDAAFNLYESITDALDERSEMGELQFSP